MNRLALEWWLHDNRRLTMAALTVCAAVVSVATRPGLREGTWSHAVVDVVGWVIVGAGLALRLWATAFIGGRKNRQLVTTGPYGIVRHPLYLGSALALLGILLIAQRLWALVPAAVVFGLYGLAAAMEDRRLSKQFPRQSEEFQRRTRAVWPQLGRLAAALRDRPGPVSRRLMLRELGCSVGFALVAMLAEISEAPWWCS
ncbi:MAG TPA: isoprenylcysteine carboxylmethyltransferase family protein [Phycisphaerae bacterium]|nr:isoprenylcysteine carboxylmethyltransferase family protein [Phycisphaerae bacterium]